MKENKINEFLKTSLENINIMVESNKIIGEPIMLPNDTIAIPISKVVCGYGVGGAEYNLKKDKKSLEFADELFPFGGGSGGGLTITPTAFIIIKNNEIKLLNVEKENDSFNKIIDVIKDIFKS